MIKEATDVWNHALLLQKRYYCLYHSYVGCNVMIKHFQKTFHRTFLDAQSRNEILRRLDNAYLRFFKRLSKTPPKVRKYGEINSVVFKSSGYRLEGNSLLIYRIKKTFRFSLSRTYSKDNAPVFQRHLGDIKQIVLKRNRLGDFFLFVYLDRQPIMYNKQKNYIDVGIDFGIKTYITLSNGEKIKRPGYFLYSLPRLKKLNRNLDHSLGHSNNFYRYKKEYNRLCLDIKNKLSAFQWNLAHELCRRFDRIFIENLTLSGMFKVWRNQMLDCSHGAFIEKLHFVASKYGVVVHTIDKFYPSSKICSCGYINNQMTFKMREWTCPECGITHDRDILAANNILRRGIVELESSRKTD